MAAPDAPTDAHEPPGGPDWPDEVSAPGPLPSSGNGMFLGGVLIVLLAVAAFLYFGSDDSNTSDGGSSQGIALVFQQSGQAQPLQQQQPQRQPQTAPGDLVVTLNMMFTQTLVRAEGLCPTIVPPPGQDFSPKTTSKVVINKTKRTIQVENTDGTKSDVATYDAATNLALITYPGAQDNRTSTVRVTDTTLDGESTFFPFRGRQGADSFVDCRFVLRTTAKAG